MIVVLGASGHTGEVVAKTLLARGQKVRVVARNADHLQPLAQLGAEALTGDVTRAESLSRAFHNAEAAYVMIPPNIADNDPSGYQDRVSDAVVSAIRTAQLKDVVALSSIGADKPSGTGPVAGIHKFEQKLNQIDGVNVLHLRAGYFMENTLSQAAAIRMLGSLAGPIRPTLKLPMIATRDIGNAAAEALLRRDFRGKLTRELLGPRDLDYSEMASIIGKAIGKPSLGYVQAPDDQLRPALAQMGMSSNVVEVLLEMARALNSGHMKALEPRSPANTTPTSFETFVSQEFVPAYERQKAA